MIFLSCPGGTNPVLRPVPKSRIDFSDTSNIFKYQHILPHSKKALHSYQNSLPVPVHAFLFWLLHQINFFTHDLFDQLLTTYFSIQFTETSQICKKQRQGIIFYSTLNFFLNRVKFPSQKYFYFFEQPSLLIPFHYFCFLDHLVHSSSLIKNS